MNGSKLLLKAMIDTGIKLVFGYNGGAIMPFYDELMNQNKIKHIMARNEQGATFMAQGVSRGSMCSDLKQVGVVLTTSGPGAMNTVTGVADAIMDSVPLIVITGQVSTSVLGSDAFQETDVVGVMIPITKETYMPLKPEDVEKIFVEAYQVGISGRPGPVNIDIPKDVQLKEIGRKYSFGSKILPFPTPAVDEQKIMEAIKLINESKRPVIFCGHGVRISNAGNELVNFAEKIHSPIASTLHGLTAFPSDHPLHLGWMGMHGTVEANRAIQYCDLIISFGMRFDDRVTGKLDEYAKEAKVIHIEIDPSEIDKNVRTSVSINGDVKEVLLALMKDKTLKNGQHKKWLEKIEGYKSETGSWHDEELKRGTGTQGKLLMKSIVTKLSEVTQGKDIVVCDVGLHQMITSKYYKFKNINTSFNSGGAGTMGASLPMSIGIKMVRPNEVVWSVSGDGGFQMNIQELGTIMENNIDIKIIILNNHFLGMVKQWQTLFFDGRYAGTPMNNPDYSFIAKAYKIPYERVTEITKVEMAIMKARNQKGAFMLEFECDSSEIVLPMVPSGKSFEDMIVNLN